MSMLIFALQALAWPASAAWIAWLAFRGYREYAQLMAAEYKDTSIGKAEALAERALRESKEARDEWETAITQNNSDISTLKTAMLNR